MRFVFQVGLAIPIIVVMGMAIPDEMNWYQGLSLGIVASMISGAWLKHFDE